MSWVQTGQGASGVVSGRLYAGDLDGDSLTAISTDGSSGVVSVYGDGGWTYTPDPALAGTGGTDSFRVTISDADSGFHFHGLAGLLNLLTLGLLGSSGHDVSVNVAVSVRPFRPYNSSPVVPTPMVDLPDLVTGVVNGSVTATDSDGDSLEYTITNAPSRGEVTVDANGVFTYTPTETARHAAAWLSATDLDKEDRFTVTVSDGWVAVPVNVTVAVRPKNSDPTATVSVGVLDDETGVITGRIEGLDADGDYLIYRGNATTPEGQVVVDPTTGVFTYSPLSRVDTVTSIITGFKSPSDVAVSPDGTRLYVSNKSAGSVSVINTETRTIVASVGSLTSPSALALSPDGQFLYVVGTGSVSVLDTTRNAIVGTVSGLYAPADGSPNPVNIAVSPDGSFAYVVNRSDGVASVVDTSTNTVISRIAGLSDNQDSFVTFSPGGRTALIGGPWLYDTDVVDTATYSIVKSSYFSGNGIAFSADGSKIYLSSSTPGIRVLDSSTLKAIAFAELPDGSLLGDLALSRDGLLIYALGTKGEVFLFDTQTNSFAGRAKYACTGCGVGKNSSYSNSANGLALAPDGTLYAVSPANGSVSVVTQWIGASTDTFSVTIEDGYGGSTSVPVTVKFVA